jgi:hypothetical protein
MNMNCLQFPVSDWPISPGGLLLVVSHLFAVSILVLWVGVGKKGKKLKLDVTNSFEIL